MNRLRHYHIDAVLDLEESNLSAFLSRWIKASQRIRFDNDHLKKGWIRHSYTQLLEIPQFAIHDIKRNLRLLNGIGINEPRVELKISIPQEYQRAADHFLQEKTPNPEGPIVGIYPGSDYRNRCWQDEKFAEMIDILTIRFETNCLLLWFLGELNLIKSIERRMKTHPFRSYPATGKSMLALIKRCQLIIAGDSAIIPMASLVKVPILGLFGPTSPYKRGPFGPNDRIIQGKLTCAPCERLYCEKSLCMDSIKVKQVVKNAMEMIKEGYLCMNKKRGG